MKNWQTYSSFIEKGLHLQYAKIIEKEGGENEF